ncbi:MAG TPA: endonuclease V [Candidatus Lokiarchaeia archaeon]|nr:endonuclease V [Candidatus Lokiarchaeia archaeon]
MRLKPIHPELFKNDITKEEAERLQYEFAGDVILQELPVPRMITGVDVAYQTTTSTGAVAVAVTMELPSLNIIETGQIAGSTSFPYVPGLLGFRELDLVARVLYTMDQPIEVVMYDGHGIAHPRRFGAASQLGVALGIPTIGCAKNLFYGQFNKDALGIEKFASMPIVDEVTGDILGTAIRMHEDVNPIFVSPGHLVNLDSAIDIVKQCASGYKLPEPLRQADIIARKRVTFFED